MNNAVVSVYSEAFFELSKEKNNLDLHKKELNQINKILSENEKFNNLLLSPTIEKSDKKDIFSKVFEGIDKDSKNLAFVLIDKSRFSIFGALTRDFNKKYNKINNIAEGIVYSANQLSQDQIKNLEEVLSKKFNKKVELNNTIDKDLIGGVSVLLEGKRIDNSIRYKLDNLKAHLRKEGE